MGSEWSIALLKEISTDVSYGYTESASSEKVGPHFLRITDIQNGVVDWSSVPYCYVTQDNHEKYRLADGDIVVARTGNSTGENFLFQGNKDAIFASYLIRFRIDREKADPRFVWYNLRSRNWWNFIGNSKTGSAQAGANAKILGNFPINLPSLSEQRTIAHILGTLDDKIELNRKMNETLEAMAQALFKSWFVDFDGVAPEDMRESEMGLIPKKWKIQRISELMVLSYGKSLPENKRHNGSVPVYGSGGITGFHDQALITEKTVIVGRKGTVGSLYWESRPCFPIDTVFYVQPILSLSFCYYLLKNMPLRSMNTDAAVPGLNRENVYRLEFPLPPLELISLFSKNVDRLRDRMDANFRQIENLVNLRDFLLPKLISGQLRIKDAEKILGNIV